MRGVALDRGRGDFVLELGIVAHERGLLADDARHAAVALREPAAEVVDGAFRVDANFQRVGAHVGTRVDAGRPAREIVALQSGEQVDADLGGGRNSVEGDATLHPHPTKVRTEGFPLTHDGTRIRKNASS